MKIPSHELEHHLTLGLKPVYFLTGNEPFLLQELRETLFRGFQSRHPEFIRFFIETASDWDRLIQESATGSLFSSCRIFDIRVQQNSLFASGKALLEKHFKALNSEDIYLFSCDKLETATYQTKWLKQIDAIGVIVQVWPISPQDMTLWLGHRIRKAGLKITRDGLDVFSEYYAGNIGGAVQALEMLSLTASGEVITLDTIRKYLSNFSHYDLFQWVDAMLNKSTRSLSILAQLKKDGVEPILVLWALVREVRLLLQMEEMLQKGTAWPAIFSKCAVWPKRQALYKKALSDRTQSFFLALLRLASHIDKAIKTGSTPKEMIWYALEDIVLKLDEDKKLSFELNR